MQKVNRWVWLTGVTLSIGVALVSGYQLLRERQVYTVRLATGGASGEYYAFGTAIAQVVAAHEPKIKIEVVESAGSPQNMQAVQARRADLALVQSDTPVLPAVQAVAQLYPEMFHLIADTAAEIDSIADLQGKRIALMPKGSGSYTLFWPLIAHYGLQPEDFQAFPMSPTEAHAALLRGDVDALFRIIGLGNESVAALLRDPAVELVPIQQIEALRLSQPYLQPTIIPQGAYDGSPPTPAADLPVVAVNALLVAHQAVPLEVVKAVTRTLYESRNELIRANPHTAQIQSPSVSQNLGIPLHPGAQAYYYQDEPNFFVEYAEPMGLLLSATIIVASGIWQFRLWLVGRQKNRADMYNLEILALIEQVHSASSLEELRSIRQQLFEILQQVVVDLDIDRISPESFQSFTFPWQVAIDTIRHREMILMNLTGTR
ncbi:TAXI family TRAP transporter solute-binding subunit [Romeria aff. gracilis LEGE 07310]|uniref:TAXI family TRAP transporter solute-binding subunit n=1 Tax=Vasconcelosia minhoensis LEGE 07310 TaxID=915328 RepID=A0A8J7AW64_9CYAN|nr:TAXI family TRAP transporter solute-binding subunit [Romeria gracilis]MBE9078213.1 TAXI family TRAP transporter solute-binding subunit [Romeria aff. gracilis LEGE 07310]